MMNVHGWVVGEHAGWRRSERLDFSTAAWIGKTSDKSDFRIFFFSAKDPEARRHHRRRIIFFHLFPTLTFSGDL